MTTCKQCGLANAAGTAYCSGCMQPLLTLSAVGAAPAQGAQRGLSSPRPPAPTARLVLLENLQPTGQVIPLPDLAYEGEIWLGRNDLAGATVVDIDVTRYGGLEKRVSRKHARLSYQAGKLALADWESKHGTYVNKVRLAPGARQALQAGDEIRLADLIGRLEVLP